MNSLKLRKKKNKLQMINSIFLHSKSKRVKLLNKMNKLLFKMILLKKYILHKRIKFNKKKQIKLKSKNYRLKKA